MVSVEIASEIQNTFLHQQKIEFYPVPIELHKYDILAFLAHAMFEIQIFKEVFKYISSDVLVF